MCVRGSLIYSTNTQAVVKTLTERKNTSFTLKSKKSFSLLLKEARMRTVHLTYPEKQSPRGYGQTGRSQVTGHRHEEGCRLDRQLCAGDPFPAIVPAPPGGKRSESVRRGRFPNNRTKIPPRTILGSAAAPPGRGPPCPPHTHPHTHTFLLEEHNLAQMVRPCRDL